MFPQEKKVAAYLLTAFEQVIQQKQRFAEAVCNKAIKQEPVCAVEIDAKKSYRCGKEIFRDPVYKCVKQEGAPHKNCKRRGSSSRA